jgi:hypothetical protein
MTLCRYGLPGEVSAIVPDPGTTSTAGACRSGSGGGRLPWREGRCAMWQKARPPRPVPVLPWVALPSGPNPAGGSLRKFAKEHVRGRQPAPSRHDQPPNTPIAAIGPRHNRRATPLVPALRAKRHSALLCAESEQEEGEPQKTQIDRAARSVGRPGSPKSARIICVICVICGCNPCPPSCTADDGASRPARSCEEAHPAQARPSPRPHSSPAAAAAHDAGVSTSSGATRPVYV